MAQKITFNNKTAINIDSEISACNKIMAEDMNEIKDIVNANSDIQVSSSDNSLVNVRHLTRAQFDAMRTNKTADINTWYEVENDEIVASTGTPAGAIMHWPGSSSAIPNNYIICDGRSLSVSDYADLFAILGYTYGGSGENFNIPDYRGRFFVHLDGTAEFATRGQKGGHKELQSHTHTRGTMDITGALRMGWSDAVSGSNILGDVGTGALFSSNARNIAQDGWGSNTNNSPTSRNQTVSFEASRNWTGATSSAGTGDGKNLPPYVVGYYIIKARNEAHTEDMRNLDNAVTELQTKMDLRGSCAVFYKSDTQAIPATTSTIIQFNNTRFVDNGCFELQGDGTIKVLKDIERIMLTAAIRGTPAVNFITYVDTSVSGAYGFNATAGTNQEMANSSGILRVAKDAIITIRTYFVSAGNIIGHDESWCGVTITVLK